MPLSPSLFAPLFYFYIKYLINIASSFPHYWIPIRKSSWPPSLSLREVPYPKTLSIHQKVPHFPLLPLQMLSNSVKMLLKCYGNMYLISSEWNPKSRGSSIVFLRVSLHTLLFYVLRRQRQIYILSRKDLSRSTANRIGEIWILNPSILPTYYLPTTPKTHPFPFPSFSRGILPLIWRLASSLPT